jgi:hypothetical protein
MAVANLKIMIMNTNGRTERYTKADERKQVICDVVKETGAALYLFQEFIWQDIRGNAWKGEYELPPQLVQIEYNKEACILFDKDEVTVENVTPINDIIQRSTLDRMCITILAMIASPRVLKCLLTCLRSLLLVVLHFPWISHAKKYR